MKTFSRKLMVLVLAFCLALGCAATVSAAGSPAKGTTIKNTKKDTITVSKKKTVKKSKTKKKNYTFNLKAKDKSGNKITYKLVSKSKCCKYIKVSKNGKVTVKKGILKHCNPKNKTHRIKVKMTTKAGKGYKAVSKTVTIKIIIK